MKRNKFFAATRTLRKPYCCVFTTVVLLLILIASVVSANAQSKDRDNPTQLTSNLISGLINSDNLGDNYYYSFVAGPGEITITLSIEAGPKSGVFPNPNQVSFELFDENARKIASKSQIAFDGRTEQAIERIRLTRRQDILLRISITEGFNSGLGKYRLRLSGAVDINQNTSSTRDSAGPPLLGVLI